MLKRNRAEDWEPTPEEATEILHVAAHVRAEHLLERLFERDPIREPRDRDDGRMVPRMGHPRTGRDRRPSRYR